jgi:hypothetical protein
MSAQITITIDPTDPQQVKALQRLIQGLSGENAGPSSLPVSGSCANDNKEPRITEPPVKTPKASKKTVETAPPATEEKAPEATQAETEKSEPAKEPAAGEIKIEDVRTLLSKKVGAHRDTIKTMLTKLGAPNVSTLAEGKYQEFTDFLNGLK